MAKRRTGVGKMKRTTSKKTPKRLAAKKEKLRELATKRAQTGNMKGCKNGRDAKVAKKILFKASRAGKAAAPKK